MSRPSLKASNMPLSSRRASSRLLRLQDSLGLRAARSSRDRTCCRRATSRALRKQASARSLVSSSRPPSSAAASRTSPCSRLAKVLFLVGRSLRQAIAFHDVETSQRATACEIGKYRHARRDSNHPLVDPITRLFTFLEIAGNRALLWITPAKPGAPSRETERRTAPAPRPTSVP